MEGFISGQGGFDNKGKTFGTVFQNGISTSYTTLLNISGKGILIGIYMGMPDGGGFKLTIDGVLVLNPLNVPGGSKQSTSIGSLFFLPFNTALKVEIVSGYAGSGTAQVTYLLD